MDHGSEHDNNPVALLHFDPSTSIRLFAGAIGNDIRGLSLMPENNLKRFHPHRAIRFCEAVTRRFFECFHDSNLEIARPLPNEIAGLVSYRTLDAEVIRRGPDRRQSLRFT